MMPNFASRNQSGSLKFARMDSHVGCTGPGGFGGSFATAASISALFSAARGRKVGSVMRLVAVVAELVCAKVKGQIASATATSASCGKNFKGYFFMNDN